MAKTLEPTDKLDAGYPVNGPEDEPVRLCHYGIGGIVRIACTASYGTITATGLLDAYRNPRCDGERLPLATLRFGITEMVEQPIEPERGVKVDTVYENAGVTTVSTWKRRSASASLSRDYWRQHTNTYRLPIGHRCCGSTRPAILTAPMRPFRRCRTRQRRCPIMRISQIMAAIAVAMIGMLGRVTLASPASAASMPLRPQPDEALCTSAMRTYLRIPEHGKVSSYTSVRSMGWCA